MLLEIQVRFALSPAHAARVGFGGSDDFLAFEDVEVFAAAALV